MQEKHILYIDLNSATIYNTPVVQQEQCNDDYIGKITYAKNRQCLPGHIFRKFCLEYIGCIFFLWGTRCPHISHYNRIKWRGLKDPQLLMEYISELQRHLGLPNAPRNLFPNY